MLNLRPLLVTLVLVAAAWLAWFQAGRGSDLEERAALTACRGKVCQTELRKRHRRLFGWRFSFETYGDRARTILVECSRPFWVVGEWECAVAESNTAIDPRFRNE